MMMSKYRIRTILLHIPAHCLYNVKQIHLVHAVIGETTEIYVVPSSGSAYIATVV